MPKSEFRIELEQLLNRHSMENGCDTPDFILARYLINALDNFNNAVNERETWYGRKTHNSNLGINIVPDLNLEPSTTEPIIDLDSTARPPDLKQSRTDESYRVCSGGGWKIVNVCNPTGLEGHNHEKEK